MKITKKDAEHLKMLRGELSKIRCWLDGFAAGRSLPGSLRIGPPGENSIRMMIIWIDEILSRKE